MKPHQIESWVLKIIEQVESGHPSEDSRVELKTTWIEAEKAARRIAGHANAARGAPILWIVGVDEKRNHIVGAEYEELSEWFEKVKMQFDGLSPELFHLNVPVEDKTVVALLFDTQRAPYVVKNPAFGREQGETVSLEVPWREGTSIRSSKRSDLILILSPLQSIPRFEVLGGFLNAKIPQDPLTELWWTIRLELYVEPESSDLLVIPFHKCKSRCELPTIGWRDFINISLSPPYSQMMSTSGSFSRIDSKTIEKTQSEILITGAGKINFMAEVVTPLISGPIAKSIQFVISLMPSNSDGEAVIDGLLEIHTPDDNEFGRWVYSPKKVKENESA